MVHFGYLSGINKYCNNNENNINEKRENRLFSSCKNNDIDEHKKCTQFAVIYNGMYCDEERYTNNNDNYIDYQNDKEKRIDHFKNIIQQKILKIWKKSIYIYVYHCDGTKKTSKFLE